MTPPLTCRRQARLTPFDPVGRLLNSHQVADDPVYSGRLDIRNLVKEMNVCGRLQQHCPFEKPSFWSMQSYLNRSTAKKLGFS